MKKIKVCIFLIFISVVTFGFLVSDTYAQIIVSMTKAEKTGQKRKGVAPDKATGFQENEPVPWYYEIEIEWIMYPRYEPLNLYRNGDVIAWDVERYDYYTYWSPLYGWSTYSYFRYFDWPPEGTWCYEAEHSIDELCETVP